MTKKFFFIYIFNYGISYDIFCNIIRLSKEQYFIMLGK